MKQIVFLFLLLPFFNNICFSQTCEDFAVELTATTQASPPQITLHWKALPDTTYYAVTRKAKNDIYWGMYTSLASVGDTTFTDTAVVVDSNYEYLVLGDYYSFVTGAYWVVRQPARIQPFPFLMPPPVAPGAAEQHQLPL